MAIKLAALGVCILAASCDPVAKPGLPWLPSPYAGQPIVPIKDLKVGEVYRTDTPNVSSDQVSYIQPICPNDFRLTNALKDITKKYASADTFVDTGGGSTITRNIESSAGLSGVNIKFLQLGANASLAQAVTYDVKGVKRVDVAPEDIQTIQAKLGSNCKNSIARYRAQGYSTFIVAGAWKASTLTTSVSVKPAADATAKIAISQALSPSATARYSDEQKIVSTGADQFFVVIPLQ